MTDKTPQQPPEGRLIEELREKPPRMSIRQAATAAGISETRWRQIENGVRWFRGEPFPESGPAPAVARMALAAGGRLMSPGDLAEKLTDAGRADAAAELAALAEQVEKDKRLSRRQRERLSDEIRDDGQLQMTGAND